MRWMTGRTKKNDRGAVLVIMTICLSVVLLGVAAIAFNTGTWYAENAQLQNGADSAAIAVAQSCALGTCEGSYALPTDLSVRLANKNANDNLETVDYVCGGMTSDDSGAYGTETALSGLATCSDSLPSWTSTGCPAPPDSANTGFVNVHTSTKTSSGDSIPVIGGLNGKPEHIKSCAQATWGFPGKATVAPFAISTCEYVDAVGNNDPAAPPPYLKSPDFTPLPPRFPPDKYDGTGTQMPVAGGETVVSLHGTPNAANGGSFDSGGTDGFNKNSGNPSPTLSNDTSTFEAGSGSLKIAWKTGASGAEWAVDAGIPSGGDPALTVGATYVLSGWVYGAGDPSVQLFVNNPTTASQIVSSTQVGDGSWHLLSIEFTAASTKVDIGLKSAAATTDGQITWLDEVSLQLKDNPRCNGSPTPTNPPSGWDQPGGFGWLSDSDGSDDCSVTVNVKHTIWDNTGASLPSACKSLLQNASCAWNTIPTTCEPDVIYVPMFDYICKQGSCDTSTVCEGSKPPGSNGCYHFTGFAGFVPTGFQLNGSGGLIQSSFISNKKYCSGNDKCVYGFFIGTFAELPNQGGGGEDFGLSFYGLSG